MFRVSLLYVPLALPCRGPIVALTLSEMNLLEWKHENVKWKQVSLTNFACLET